MIARRSLSGSIERFEIGRYWLDDRAARLISRPGHGRRGGGIRFPPCRRSSGAPPRGRRPADPASDARAGLPAPRALQPLRDRGPPPVRSDGTDLEESARHPWSRLSSSVPHPLHESIHSRPPWFARAASIGYRPLKAEPPASPIPRRGAPRGDDTGGRLSTRRSIRAADRREPRLPPLRAPHLLAPELQPRPRRGDDDHRAQRRR